MPIHCIITIDIPQITISTSFCSTDLLTCNQWQCLPSLPPCSNPDIQIISFTDVDLCVLQMSNHFWNITRSYGRLISIWRWRCIPGLGNYIQRLTHLCLPRLETFPFSTSFDFIWCYKILFGHANISSQDFFELWLSSTCGQPYKLFKQHCNSTVRSAFFKEPIINIWNSLLCDFVDFSSPK